MFRAVLKGAALVRKKKLKKIIFWYKVLLLMSDKDIEIMQRVFICISDTNGL